VAFFDIPHLAATIRFSRAFALCFAAVLVSSIAQAQTCVGTDNIVCTNTGNAGAIGDPPSGALTGTTSLTNINTSTGTAATIQTTANRGDATTINYGTVTGNVGSNLGDFGVDAVVNATVYNYGTIGGVVRAITYFSNNATIYNAGTAGTLIANVNSSTYGSAQVYNSGTTRNISVAAASTFFGQTLVVNSGTVTGLIANFNPVRYVFDNTQFGGVKIADTVPAALTINTGTAGTIYTHTDNGGLVSSINYGTVGDILTEGATAAQIGNAESINSGHAGNISTTTGGFMGTVTTTNETTGVAGNLSASAINFANAAVINNGVANNLTSTATNGSATIVNSGTAGAGNAVVLATSDNGPASVVNTGTIHGVAKVTSGYAGSAGPGSFLTNSGLIDGSGQYAAIDITENTTGGRTTLNLLSGSRIIGAIILACDTAAPGTINTTVNINSSTRARSSVLTFGDGAGECGINDGSRVTVSNAISVISGNSVALVDPSSFAVANRNVVEVTQAIQSLVAGRLANPAPASSDGQAMGFAPSGNVARDMANNAFAAIPGLASANQDRILMANPNFTTADGTSVWMQGFGGRRVAPEDGPVLRSINNFFGGALGIDRTVQPRLRIGAYVGGGNVQSDLDANAGRTNTDIGFGGLYGRYTLNGAFVDFSLLGGCGGDATSRTVDNNLAPGGSEIARANYANWFVSPELAYGLALPLDTRTTLTPSARLRYLAAGFGGYQETGSAADMTVAARLAHYIEERGGISLSHELPSIMQGRLQLTGTAGISALQRAGDSDINAVLLGQSLAFATPGRGNVTGLYAGAGVDWRHVSGASLFATAEFNTMSDASRTITGRGGFRINF
jgi:hypothetical protein